MENKRLRPKKIYTQPKVERILLDGKNIIKGCLVCPHLFVWDGIRYVKENSILPDSEDILRKERDIMDYYVLNTTPVPKGKYLSFKIKELANDISYFKQFVLLTAEHPQEVCLGVTKRGRIYPYKEENFILPENCQDKEGKEITSIRDFDVKEFYQAKPGDCLYLEFKRPNSSARLLILDPTDLGEGRKYLASNDQAKTSIYIHLFVESKWKCINVFHTRTNFYLDIVDLTPHLFNIKDKLIVKLEFTAFHKVAFVGLDVTPFVKIRVREYQIIQAIHSKLGDVTETLRRENNEYVKLSPMEEIELNFPVPTPPTSKKQLTYILMSKGYYIPIAKILQPALVSNSED